MVDWIEPSAIVPDLDEQGRKICLGTGTFGTVVLAKLHGDPVCVKVFVGIGATAQTKALFEQELGTHLNLRSPRIVQIFGACEVDSNLGIVLEYVAGGSLHSQLERQRQSGTPVDWAKHLPIAMQIAAGVTYLHGKKIIHRDLKSLNVLIDANGAKLCDFGLAITKKTSKSTLSSGNQGTVFWMAPELFGMRAKYTEASDVYGMAMVFLELCTNQIPWDEYLDGQPPMIISNWLKDGERPDIPPSAPADFRALIESAWAQEVGARPAAAEILQQLQAMLGGASPAPAPAPAPARAPAAAATGPPAPPTMVPTARPKGEIKREGGRVVLVLVLVLSSSTK
jgi:serine/threonine protein kinase